MARVLQRVKSSRKVIAVAPFYSPSIDTISAIEKQAKLKNLRTFIGFQTVPAHPAA
jgi:hypothetical protein